MAEHLHAANLAGLAGIRHGFFTRSGGVSGDIYATLNCGLGSRDDPAAVAENRARAARALGVDTDALATPHQVHSPAVVVADRAWPDGAGAPRADALVTARAGLAVGVATADCAPILFAAPDARVIAAAHAGWRGALAGIVAETVAAMERLGARRGAIRAAIGPTISQAAYEVGPEFRDRFLAADPAHARFFAAGDRPHFDLPGFLLARLRETGIDDAVDLGLCTYADETRWFSYRRATHHGEQDYGRLLAAIVLAA